MSVVSHNVLQSSLMIAFCINHQYVDVQLRLMIVTINNNVGLVRRNGCWTFRHENKNRNKNFIVDPNTN